MVPIQALGGRCPNVCNARAPQLDQELKWWCHLRQVHPQNRHLLLVCMYCPHPAATARMGPALWRTVRTYSVEATTW